MIKMSVRRWYLTCCVGVISILISFTSMVYAQSTVPAPGGNTVERSLDIGDVMCPTAPLFSNLLSGVCWEGMFPMYIGGVRLGGKSKYAPRGRNKERLCACGGNIENGVAPTAGTSLGMFRPVYLMEVVAKPYCFPSLGTELSSKLGLVSRFNVGNEDAETTETMNIQNNSSFSWHLAMFPVARILELLDDFSCNTEPTTTFDYFWMSETLPMYYDEVLANVLTPENLALSAFNALGQVLAMAVAPVDCIASSTYAPINGPIDELFWAAGCNGSSVYPLAAPTGTNSDKVASKELIVTKGLYFLSRIGMLERTVGEDVICRPAKMPFLRRSQYRYSRFYPMPEAKSNDSICTGTDGCESASAASSGSSATGPDAPGRTRTGVSETGNVSANELKEIAIDTLNSTCTHKNGESTWRHGIHRDAKDDNYSLTLIFQWSDCCLDALTFL